MTTTKTRAIEMANEGRPLAELAEELLLALSEDGRLVVGYVAYDDSGYEVEYDPAEWTAAGAADDYASAFDARDKTYWVNVKVERELLDQDGDMEREDVESFAVTVAPEVPDCVDGREHEFIAPHEVVGGIESNPGVWGSGGGVVCREVCRWCGTQRVTDTWAQNPATGEQGLTSVEYEAPEKGWIVDGKGALNALLRDKLDEHAEEIAEGDEEAEEVIDAAIRRLLDKGVFVSATAREAAIEELDEYAYSVLA